MSFSAVFNMPQYIGYHFNINWIFKEIRNVSLSKTLENLF